MIKIECSVFTNENIDDECLNRGTTDLVHSPFPSNRVNPPHQSKLIIRNSVLYRGQDWWMLFCCFLRVAAVLGNLLDL